MENARNGTFTLPELRQDRVCCSAAVLRTSESQHEFAVQSTITSLLHPQQLIDCRLPVPPRSPAPDPTTEALHLRDTLQCNGCRHG